MWLYSGRIEQGHQLFCVVIVVGYSKVISCFVWLYSGRIEPIQECVTGKSVTVHGPYGVMICCIFQLDGITTVRHAWLHIVV